MFNKIKRNLMKYFSKSEPEAQILIDNAVNGPDIKPLKGVNIDAVIMDDYQAGVDLAKNEDLTSALRKAGQTTSEAAVNIGKFISSAYKTDTKKEDPKEKLKIKLEIIAKRTKSRRIREKNLKRLVNLFGDY